MRKEKVKTFEKNAGSRIASAFGGLVRDDVIKVSIIVCSSVFLFSLSGCKKKDKMTGNNVSFSINPAAVSVVKGQTQTLTAQALTPNGLVATNPEWTVSGTAGTLNTLIGPQVIVNATGLGDLTITATADGMVATSQVVVVTFIPSASTYDVYTDLGLPVTNTVAADIATNASANPAPGAFGLSELSTGYTPDGNNYQRALDAFNGSFWGVNLAANQAGLDTDLSNFSAGTLQFAIRLGRDISAEIGGGAVLRIEILDTPGSQANVATAMWTGFSATSTDWQEISISAATIFAGVDETQVRVPFQIAVTSGFGSQITFDVDAVRWTN